MMNEDISPGITQKPIFGYWKMRGLAQPSRFLLAYLDVRFEDRYYELGAAPEYSIENWTSVRETLGLDFPNLPYLIDREVRLTEPQAIIKYLATYW